MTEKFNPAPPDKQAETADGHDGLDRRAHDELSEGLKESFPASDAPSSAQPSATKTEKG
jgi:hypothetical protein